MPYRRLPNTDAARLRAMETAIKKIKAQNPDKIPVNAATFQDLSMLFPKYNQAVIQNNATKEHKAGKSKEYNALVKKARLYVSHFIHIINMSITRGEMKSEVLEFFGLENYKKKLPPLKKEKELLKWGKKIIEGEPLRLQNGGTPLYNPSIALVKVNYEKFADAYYSHQTLKSSTERTLSQVENHREKADALILKLWNEIESYYSFLPDQDKRDKASEFGVVYFYRKAELQKMKFAEAQWRLEF